jgi:hypothetical protein
MESIRARMASRINGTYTNENMTDTFKTLGLYNNNSASLQAQNGANAGAAGTAAAVFAQKHRLVTISEAL